MKIKTWLLIHNKPLEKSENPQNSTIFKNTGSHDVEIKKKPKPAKLSLITLFLVNKINIDL